MCVLTALRTLQPIMPIQHKRHLYDIRLIVHTNSYCHMLIITCRHLQESSYLIWGESAAWSKIQVFSRLSVTACHPERDNSLIAPMLGAIHEAKAAFRARICTSSGCHQERQCYQFSLKFSLASSIKAKSRRKDLGNEVLTFLNLGSSGLSHMF